MNNRPKLDPVSQAAIDGYFGKPTQDITEWEGLFDDEIIKMLLFSDYKITDDKKNELIIFLERAKGSLKQLSRPGLRLVIENKIISADRGAIQLTGGLPMDDVDLELKIRADDLNVKITRMQKNQVISKIFILTRKTKAI